MKKEKTDKLRVSVEAIQEFIDGFARLDKNHQLILLGMLKGMVAVNDVGNINELARR